jgi:hypothetical protein
VKGSVVSTSASGQQGGSERMNSTAPVGLAGLPGACAATPHSLALQLSMSPRAAPHCRNVQRTLTWKYVLWVPPQALASLGSRPILADFLEADTVRAAVLQQDDVRCVEGTAVRGQATLATWGGLVLRVLSQLMGIMGGMWR